MTYFLEKIGENSCLTNLIHYNIDQKYRSQQWFTKEPQTGLQKPNGFRCALG